MIENPIVVVRPTDKPLADTASALKKKCYTTRLVREKSIDMYEKFGYEVVNHPTEGRPIVIGVEGDQRAVLMAAAPPVNPEAVAAVAEEPKPEEKPKAKSKK